MRIYLIIFILLSTNFYSQSDSTKIENIFEWSPNLHGIQIDGSYLLFGYGFGGQFDYDLLHANNINCIGIRLSIEKYYLSDLGGSIHGSLFTNYNIYARLSRKIEFLSIDLLGGFTYYKTNAPNRYTNKNLFRLGFELKYGDLLGIILKGSAFFKERTGFIGLGVFFGYNHIE